MANNQLPLGAFSSTVCLLWRAFAPVKRHPLAYTPISTIRVCHSIWMSMEFIKTNTEGALFA